VQQALLKIVEGTCASVPPQGGRKHPHQELLQIETKDILFICGGAFVGLDKVIGQRIGQSSIGFGAHKGKTAKNAEDIFTQVTPDDLIRFGMIPEFVGRIPVVRSLSQLDEEDLIRILTETKNSITEQYIKSFAIENVALSFDEAAIRAIAGLAIKRGTGARGLRAIIEDIMLDLMYEIPSLENISECRITEAVVREREKPPMVFAAERPRGEPSGSAVEKLA